jgi:hypothetical protein
MNYANLLTELNKASLFDLHRLRVAMSNEMDNPRRILAVKRNLQIGMELTYFDAVENRLIKAKLLELRQKKVLVLDTEQQKKFVMPYHMLNVDGIETSIHESSDVLTINNLKVGERVGFTNSRNGQLVAGIIKRLNHKTVTLETNQGKQWRASYRCLHRIHESEIAMERLSKQTIQGEAYGGRLGLLIGQASIPDDFDK